MQVYQNEKKQVAIIKAHGCPVAILGSELLSKKDLVTLEYCLNTADLDSGNENRETQVISFRDDNRVMDKDGKPLNGVVAPNINAIGINLLQIFSDAVVDCIDEPVISVVAAFHWRWIKTVLHEQHHLETLKDKNLWKMTEEEINESEDDAEKWATETLFALAKTVDIDRNIIK